jgi:hypothetical protein
LKWIAANPSFYCCASPSASAGTQWYNDIVHSALLFAATDMRRSNKFANPFYSLLLMAGIAFALTATAYGVMAFREARPMPQGAVTVPDEKATEHPLMAWMSQHGEAAMLTELGFLAVFVFGAIGTDGYWQLRRAQNR